MTAASTYLKTKFLDALLRGVSFESPSKIYIGLHTSDPTDDGGHEVSHEEWPAYVRKESALGGSASSGWDEIQDGETKNSKNILFPALNSTQNLTVTHFALYDSVTGGNMLTHAVLTTPRIIQPGDVFAFDSGAITVSLD